LPPIRESRARTARTRRAGLGLSSRLCQGAVREWLGVYPPSDGAQPNQATRAAGIAWPVGPHAGNGRLLCSELSGENDRQLVAEERLCGAFAKTAARRRYRPKPAGEPYEKPTFNVVLCGRPALRVETRRRWRPVDTTYGLAGTHYANVLQGLRAGLRRGGRAPFFLARMPVWFESLSLRQ